MILDKSNETYLYNDIVNVVNSLQDSESVNVFLDCKEFTGSFDKETMKRTCLIRFLYGSHDNDIERSQQVLITVRLYLVFFEFKNKITKLFDAKNALHELLQAKESPDNRYTPLMRVKQERLYTQSNLPIWQMDYETLVVDNLEPKYMTQD